MNLLAAILAAVVFVQGMFAQVGQPELIKSTHDPVRDLTTVRSQSVHLSGDKDQYHSLDFTLHYSHPGKEPRIPERINFDLVSVVKARKLNSDLYVVFVVNGKPIHYSSNRSAIRNPVPGRLWVGERMVFLIPYDEFLKLAAAEKLSIKLGGVEVPFSGEARDAVRAFAKGIGE
jgi:hypothetical protein